MPERVESSLFVVEPFTDSAGSEWQPGDRAPLVQLAVREAAAANPGWFRVEFATEPFDPAAGWFREIVDRYEHEYAEAKRHRDGAEERRQAALRAELREQERSQPELERRYKRQEAEKAEREKRMREERERRQIENEMRFPFHTY